MPNPRSFTEYVGGRFYNELCDAVTDVIEEKQDALDLNLRNVHTIDSIEVTDVEVKHVWVNDLPGMEIEFDVAVCAELYVHERDYHYDESETAYKWFMVSFRGDLEKELDDVTVTGKDIYNGKGRYQNPLDDALVPVIKPEQLEKVAEQFLRDHYPKALLQPMWLEPTELAGELGLKVIRKRITKDGDIFGRIFFYDAVTEIYDPDQDKMVKKKARAKMILVDPEAAYQNNIGALNNTIVHECVHWGLHRKAFMLEHLYNKELTQIGCVVRGGIAGNKKDSTDWMEWQANALAPRIQMPKDMFKKRVDALISKFRRELGEYDIVDIIQPIIEQLTIDFGVSRTAAKLRLNDIGYDETIGAFNYVDGRYVQPHKATPGFLQKNQTFSISARDAAILAWTNPFLKSVLEEGRYVYVDSHYVVDHPRYLEADASGKLVLTHYARNHMDECALVFDLSVQSGEGERYHTECFLNRDKASTVVFNVGFSNGLQNSTNIEKQRKAVAAQLMSENQLIATLTDDYIDSLEKAVKWRSEVEGERITAVEIGKRAGINEATVRRALNGDKNSKTETLVLICLALHLPYKASHKIIDNSPSPLVLRDTNHQWYDFALQHLCAKTVEEVKDELASYGADPL